MIETGYIKLYRALLEKPIWLNSTPEQKSILIVLLLMANHKGKTWEWNCEKFNISPGQFVTSLDSIKKQCGKGVSSQNIRTCLKRFEKLEFLTNKSTKMGRIITIINWGSYQPDQKKLTKDLTVASQSTNKALTPNKNVRKKEVDIYSRVITYLNKKTGKHFRVGAKETTRLIDIRLNEGFKPEDFKTVIDNKVFDFKKDKFEHTYLRPQTLFGTKFESYLNQIIKPLNGDDKILTQEELLEKHGF